MFETNEVVEVIEDSKLASLRSYKVGTLATSAQEIMCVICDQWFESLESEFLLKRSKC